MEFLLLEGEMKATPLPQADVARLTLCVWVVLSRALETTVVVKSALEHKNQTFVASNRRGTSLRCIQGESNLVTSSHLLDNDSQHCFLLVTTCLRLFIPAYIAAYIYIDFTVHTQFDITVYIHGH